jgi:hypothetical protein
MYAFFNPPVSLEESANACHFQGFNWQQTLTVPDPSPYRSGLDHSTLTGSFPDPPQGGYFIENRLVFTDSYPFYYSPSDLASGILPDPLDLNPKKVCNQFSPLFVQTSTSLNFFDVRIDHCLPGPTRLPPDALCNGKLANPGSVLSFTTSLVGVLPGNVPSPPLFTWNWTSSLNGRSGGVSQTKGSLTPDQGASGGVTITSIGGLSALSTSIKTSPEGLLVSTDGSMTGRWYSGFGYNTLVNLTSGNYKTPTGAAALFHNSIAKHNHV